MSSAGQKPRKRCFVSEIPKQLDVRYIASVVLRSHKPHFHSLGSEVYSLFIISPLNCSVDYAYEKLMVFVQPLAPSPVCHASTPPSRERPPYILMMLPYPLLEAVGKTSQAGVAGRVIISSTEMLAPV